jgi:hypothetical protein
LAPRGDDGSRAEVCETGAHQGVTGVGALRRCRQAQTGRLFGLEVLGRVHSSICLAGEHCSLQLADEDSSASHFPNGEVRRTVSSSRQRHELDLEAGVRANQE